MNLLWLLIAAANSLVIVDYDGGPVQGDAWITLTIHGDPSQLLSLQHVTWCKSFVPNEDGPSPLAPDCGGRNLMRLQLFPSAEEVVLKELPSSEVSATTVPTESLLPRFYIDPARVGGWDTRHQWNIYLEMSQRNGVLHQESIRFNPLTPATTTTTTIATPTAIPSSSSVEEEKETTTTVVNGDSILTQNPGGTVVTVHSWKGALLVLSVGTFLILGTVAGIQFLRTNNRRRQPSLAHQRDQMQGQLYGGTYAFQHESIEMADFSASSQEDPEEEERLRQEDLQILEMIK